MRGGLLIRRQSWLVFIPSQSIPPGLKLRQMLDDLSLRIPAALIRIPMHLHCPPSRHCPRLHPGSTDFPRIHRDTRLLRLPAFPSPLHPSQENIPSQTLLSSFSKCLLRSHTVSTCVARSQARNTFPQNSSLLASGGARWSRPEVCQFCGEYGKFS